MGSLEGSGCVKVGTELKSRDMDFPRLLPTALRLPLVATLGAYYVQAVTVTNAVRSDEWRNYSVGIARVFLGYWHPDM